MELYIINYMAKLSKLFNVGKYIVSADRNMTRIALVAWSRLTFLRIKFGKELALNVET